MADVSDTLRTATRGPELHHLAGAFVWQDPPPGGARRRLTDAEVAAFARDGFVVVRNALDAATIAQVTDAIDPFEAQHEAWLRTREGQRAMISMADAITFTTHLVKRSETCRAFAAHPVFQDICFDLIGPDVRLYWDQAVYKKGPKEQEFPWHQDNGYTFVEPQQYVTCWVPLVDVDEANGCPWLIPGMHRMGTLRHWMTDVGLVCLERPSGAVPVPARAGDVVVFSSLAPHRTGPNLTDGIRKAYILQYAPDGAEAVKPDGTRIPQDDPERQFRIRSSGQ